MSLRYLVTLCLWTALWPAFAAGQNASHPLTNKEVIALVKGRLADSMIVSAIQAQDTNFDISPASLVALKQNRVSSRVIDAMIAVKSKQKSSSQTPAAVSARSADPSEKKEAEQKNLATAAASPAACSQYALKLSISGSYLSKEFKYRQQASFTMSDAQVPLTFGSNRTFSGQGKGTVAAAGSTVMDDTKCAGSTNIPLTLNASGNISPGASPVLRGHITVAPGTASSSSSCGSMRYQAGPPTSVDFELPATVGAARIVNLPVQEASLPLKIGLVRLDGRSAAATVAQSLQDNSIIVADAATCAAKPAQ